MKATKILIIVALLLVPALQAPAQTGKTTKSLDNLDLIKIDEPTKNARLDFVTPNEMPGYEFFGKGKLGALRLGTSARAEVARVFGSDCEKPCVYNAEWTMTVDYFKENTVIVSRQYAKNRSAYTEKQYVPRKEAIGKIESIGFYPKKRVSLLDAAFPVAFVKSVVFEPAMLSRDKDDSLAVSLDFYGDNYGLQYFIFDRFVNDRQKDTFNLKKEYAGFRRGDLVSIKYVIPETMESRFLIEEQ